LKRVNHVNVQKLSKLQNFIMVTLLAPDAQALTRKEFSRYVYAKYYGHDKPSAKASLSRAYRRLMQRGFLRRTYRGLLEGGWELTPLDGRMVAALELAEHKDKYPHIQQKTSAKR
jgi:hypothetical protein